MSNYRHLITALRRLRKNAEVGGVTIGHVLDTLQEAGFCLVAVFLALPFLQPLVPLGPFSTASGFAFIVLGAQLLMGYPEPVLPKRIRGIPVAPKLLSLITVYGLKFLGWYRRHTRRRYLRWVSGRRGQVATGGIMLGGGLIMIVPFFGIPLNDFFPALAIVSACLGELEQDGLMIFVAIAWLAIGAMYCAFLLVTLARFGWETFSYFL